MGRSKGREREAAFGEPRHDRKGSQIEFEKMRTNDLAGDADIGKARLGAQRKGRRRPPCKKPLIGRESFSGLVLSPILDRMRIGSKGLCEMITNARHH